MRCVICRAGTTHPGTAIFTVDRDGHTFVLRKVPALICPDCGEAYFDEATTQRVYDQVERAGESGVDVAVLNYKAA
jgi:YgiT-type zinc finger domain-containing protein